MGRMIVLAVVLLVCARIGGDAEATDNTIPGDNIEPVPATNEANVRKDPDASETSEPVLMPSNDSSATQKGTLNPATRDENIDNNPGIKTVDENEKMNDTSNDNDTASSTSSTSLPTSTLPTHETELNVTTDENTSTDSSNATDSVETPGGSDSDKIAQTTGRFVSFGTTKSPQRAPKSFIGLYIILPIVAAAVAVLFVLCVVMMYTHKDRICRNKEREVKREPEPEIVDCDQDLYSTVNYRHHGARAENRTLSQNNKLMTKMESEDECLTDNSLDLDEKMESGRYVSPEGLVYVSLAQTSEEGNRKSAPKKNQKKKKNQEKPNSQYATLDFDKTGKLILKTGEKKSKKEKKKTNKKNKA